MGASTISLILFAAARLAAPCETVFVETTLAQRDIRGAPREEIEPLMELGGLACQEENPDLPWRLAFVRSGLRPGASTGRGGLGEAGGGGKGGSKLSPEDEVGFFRLPLSCLGGGELGLGEALLPRTQFAAVIWSDLEGETGESCTPDKLFGASDDERRFARVAERQLAVQVTRLLQRVEKGEAFPSDSLVEVYRAHQRSKAPVLTETKPPRPQAAEETSPLARLLSIERSDLPGLWIMITFLLVAIPPDLLFVLVRRNSSRWLSLFGRPPQNK